MAPGGGPQSQAETEIFGDALRGPELEAGWRWLREENASWHLGDDGLEIQIKPGGIWSRVFSELPGPPVLLRTFDGANAFEVTVTMPSTPGKRGEQAGIFWYIDDDNYAKLVVEWDGDGTASVVFAQEDNCEPTVCGKASLDGDAAYEPIRLRMELSGDGSQLSGVVNGAYYMRLVGRCSASSSGWGSRTASIGLSAHGGTAESTGRVAKLAAFSSIAVRPDRVQWGGLAATDVTAAPIHQEATSMPGGNSSGWTLSSNLTEAQRSQISAMLGMNGLPTLGGEDLQPAELPAMTPPVTEPSGWTLSSALTEAERQEISTLLVANGLPALEGEGQSAVPNGESAPENGVANGRSRSRSPSPTA